MLEDPTVRVAVFPLVVSPAACRRTLSTALAAPAFPPVMAPVASRGALLEVPGAPEALAMSLLVMEVLVAPLSSLLAGALLGLLETLRLSCFDHPMTKVKRLSLLYEAHG